MLKFIQGLKPQIMSLVYAGNPQNLNDAITTARNVEGKLVMANESKQVYALEDQIAQLSEQVNALTQGGSQRIPMFSPAGGSSAKKGLLYFNCQNEGHMARKCNRPQRCRSCRKAGHGWETCPNTRCNRCHEMGHVASKCMSERVHLVKEEDQSLKEFQVELLRILKKPVTFAKPVIHQDPYDILEDLWSTSAHVTYGQLFQDPKYKIQIIKIFEEKIEPVQALTSK